MFLLFVSRVVNILSASIAYSQHKHFSFAYSQHLVFRLKWFHMENDKKYYLYILVPENGKDFKIGISCGPMDRFKGLNVKPDLEYSRLYASDNLTIKKLEKALHTTFFPWNAPWEKSNQGGKTEWFTKDCLDRVFQHIDFLDDLWGGLITLVNNEELLKCHVNPVVSRKRECIDVTSQITFANDEAYAPLGRINMVSPNTGGIKSSAEMLLAMYRLREKYPWDVAVTRIPIEEFESVVESKLFKNDPDEFFFQAAMTRLDCFYGLGNSSRLVTSWFMPIKFSSPGYLEAEPSEFTKSVKEIDFKSILSMLNQ